MDGYLRFGINNWTLLITAALIPLIAYTDSYPICDDIENDTLREQCEQISVKNPGSVWIIILVQTGNQIRYNPQIDDVAPYICLVKWSQLASCSKVPPKTQVNRACVIS